MEHIKKLFTFSGRVGRKYFALWWLGFVTFTYGLASLLARLEGVIVTANKPQSILLGVVIFVVMAAVIVSSFSVIVRRMRDAGYYGVWMLIILVPVVNAVFSVMLFFLPSETEEERKRRMRELYRSPEERQDGKSYISFGELEKRAEASEEGNEKFFDYSQEETSRTAIFITITLFLFFGVGGYLAYQEVTKQSPADVKTTSDFYTESATSTSSSIPDSWKIYRSEEQGLSLAYPDAYTELEADTATDFESESFHAQASGYPQISLQVHDIDTFSAGSDVGGTWPRFYITEEDRWVERSGEQEKPVRVDEVGAVDGYSVYLFETANIPNTTRTYAIPVPDQGEMVELTFTYNTVEESPDYTNREVDEQQILSSLQIADERGVSDQDESIESWRSYQNVSHWFSFAYPEKWALSTSESEESDVVVARVVNPKFSGRADTDIPTEQFLVREMSYGACESGEESSLADRDTLDTGWITDEFTGLPLRDICFQSQEKPLKITLSARDDSSKNTLNRMLNSFDFTALPDTPLTLEDIKSQYTDELLQSAAFADEVDGNQAVVSRVPIRFSAWDQIGTEDEPLTVINLLYTESAEMPNGYEIILFDTDSSHNISNPIRIDGGSTAGSYSEDATDYEITPYDTPGHFAVNLEIRIPEIVNDSDEKRYIEKEFARTDGEVDIISDNQDTEDFFLYGIKAQYTDELLSDPAFITKGNMVKGGREFTVTSRTPKASVFWDHDNDGEESLAVLNNASNVFELILFDIDENNQISNPQLIDNGGTATYVWDSADLQLTTADGEEFLRSSIRLGQSALQTNDYTYVQLFDATGQFVKIDDGEVQ